MLTAIPDSATLAAYFYFDFSPRDKEAAANRELVDSFIAHWTDLLRLVPKETTDHYLRFYRRPNEGSKAELLVSWIWIDSERSVKDTALVQLLWDEPGEVPAAWERAQQFLDAGLQPFLARELSDANAQQKSFLRALTGCTVLFQAEANTLEGELPETLAQATTGRSHAKPVADTFYEDGRLWLLTLPAGLGLAARSVYVALLLDSSSSQAAAAQCKKFINEVLRSPGSHFANADLVAHKAHFQHYHKRDIISLTYTPQLEAVFTTTQKIMESLGALETGSNKSVELAKKFGELLVSFNELNNLDNSLQQQQYNMQAYVAEGRGQAVWQSQLDFINFYRQDAGLLLSKSKVALESAQTTLAFVQQQQDRTRNKEQDKNNRLLGLLGIVVALVSLFKGEALIAFYHRFSPWHTNVGAIATSDDLKSQNIFEAEFLVFALLGFVLLGWYRSWKWRRVVAGLALVLGLLFIADWLRWH